VKLIRIDHASLDTDDREATLAWYSEVLGLERAHPGEGTAPGEPMFLGEEGAQVALSSLTLRRRGSGISRW
jgi:catechol 2,3-dioxygenase-like lactoylglutathione lyase family enzyme